MSPIVSASRRTDLPAFYADWFMHRLSQGFADVVNPYNPAQVSRVSLQPGDVDAFVFWSKNPAPMVPCLDRIAALGHRFYFQFTLNDYPDSLEPGLPPVDERIATFRRLSGRLGPGRVIWRYDPVILSDRTGPGYHLEVFARLCGELGDHTRRVSVSLIDYYRKTLRNLRPLERAGFSFVRDASGRAETDDLLGELAGLAHRASLEIVSCAEGRDLAHLGIAPGACIDGDLLRSLWGIDKHWKKDPGQRTHCRCVVSRDIGAFDSCLHGCPYCYATGDREKARDRHRRHSPESVRLW